MRDTLAPLSMFVSFHHNSRIIFIAWDLKQGFVLCSFNVHNNWDAENISVRANIKFKIGSFATQVVRSQAQDETQD